MSRGRDLDEDDVRSRPGRGSRPRTRLRPKHADARSGLVVTVDRGRYTVLADGETVTAMRARELGRGSVVVGDQVAFIGGEGPEGLGRIVRVEPRRSVLRRTADDTDPVERVIVANADQLVIVTAVADPQPRTRMIDRCLVAALEAGLDPLLCLTKTDLASPEDLLAAYDPLGVPHVTWRRGDPLAAIAERLHGRTSVLVGYSGVGKSTLVNALVPGADRRTGGVNVVTGRGRHTSSSAVALALPGGGWVIDTPGLRSFGLAHVDAADVVAAFPDLEAVTAHCPPGCDHSGSDPHCALDGPQVDPSRVTSLRRLLRAPSESPDTSED